MRHRHPESILILIVDFCKEIYIFSYNGKFKTVNGKQFKGAAISYFLSAEVIQDKNNHIENSAWLSLGNSTSKIMLGMF